MPEVIITGKGAGMTTVEYEEMRRIDCNVAQRLGWSPANTKMSEWQFGPTRALHRRDDDLGVPFYSYDANGAHIILSEVVRWRYAAQQIFWAWLQKLSTYESGLGHIERMAVWPDAFTALIPKWSEHVSIAFLNTWQEFDRDDFNPYRASAKATAFAAEHVKTEVVEETDENGLTTRKVAIAGSVKGQPPWVH